MELTKVIATRDFFVGIFGSWKVIAKGDTFNVHLLTNNFFIVDLPCGHQFGYTNLSNGWAIVPDHPFLANNFPNHVVSEVLMGTVKKFVVYSDDTSHGLILGMGYTKGAAFDNAEKTARQIILSQG